MPSTLHIIRRPDDAKALECIKAQANDGALSLLLMQEGIHTKPPSGVKAYILTDTPDNAGIQSDMRTIAYDEMVKLLFEHDTVVVW
ncbi:MAG: hypothetical protein JSV84_17075 [Gemmatimonadota bacterium]|nr:MAG: hypothetical protein JSV84_17075 [Gemmatimonadota bacterium]